MADRDSHIRTNYRRLHYLNNSIIEGQASGRRLGYHPRPERLIVCEGVYRERLRPRVYEANAVLDVLQLLQMDRNLQEKYEFSTNSAS